MDETTDASWLDTALGPLRLDGGDVLRAIRFADGAPESNDTDATRQLGEYFAGERRKFELRLDARGTKFQRSVWAEVAKIPYGETRTYLQIAEALGDRNLTRAVGAANGANPLPIVIPCHRVVGVDGSLTGYAGGVERKRWLLDHESPQTNLFG